MTAADPQHARFFVLGATGMLGRAWVELLKSHGPGSLVEAAGSGTVDITDPGSLGAIPEGVTHVINCAAYTRVDDAEHERERANAVNGDGVAHLARRCAQIDATLVHYSTDYVFPGDARDPIPTDAPRDPINAYGASKALGEAALESSDARWVNIRTSWLYAPYGKNFVQTIARASAERSELRVVNDQTGNPTSAVELARSTRALLAKIDAGDAAGGHWHITDGGSCTWFEFAAHIVRSLGRACTVNACSSDELGFVAPRPAYSVLDLSEIERVLGAPTRWETRVAAALRDSGHEIVNAG